jgi:hypothetical protein
MLMRRLYHDIRGVALIEFAVCLPLLLVLLLGGVELTNQVVTRNRLSQIAMMVADNASRIGDDTVLGPKPINEREINDLLLGAEIESGNLNFSQNGRVILSSVERKNGKQYIHWQRCFGLKADFQPSQREGETTPDRPFSGPTAGTTTLAAAEGDAIMLVELAYDYQPIVPLPYAITGADEFRSTAAMNVRDKRDLSGVKPYPGTTASTCA